MTDRELPAVTDRDVYITRSFAAPIDVVWKFWTDPDLLVQWFGPHMVTVPRESVEVDVREGGTWKLTMEDEYGVHPLTATILIAEPPTYLEMSLAADTGFGELDNVIVRVQLGAFRNKLSRNSRMPITFCVNWNTVSNIWMINRHRHSL